MKCYLCPRMCGIERENEKGFCGGGKNIKAALSSLHMWEEPPISGINGSGTIFFSGCSLKCCFCQNYKISSENFGKEISEDELASIMLSLKERGAHNINLVTPTHYADKIACVLKKIKPQLLIPVIYNSSGYENENTIDMLDGLVDIYMPDLKYFSSYLSARYSSAPDYFKKASAAIIKMYSQVGKIVYGDDGLLKKGLIIRHMILPGAYKDSLMLLEWIEKNFDKEKILVSLMCQYTPCYKSSLFSEINRRLTSYEYKKVTDMAAEKGLNGFFQDKSSSSKNFIPNFNLEGI